ncbi:MAG: YfcE family phosphodiesterase [Clostridia bacterium]|jgi:putative phosphoesterase|nr:YfcE family phosphodiesterase [Clostridia bacterium]
MRLAVITDIHSNILALNAVLKNIHEHQADSIVCLGDLVGYCTSPNEVIDTIRENKILTIMGNYDEAVGKELMVCGCDYPDPKDMENAGLSLNWSIDNTTEENKEFLRNLPGQLRMDCNGKSISFVHGSPRLINEYLKENSKEAEEVMKDFSGDVLVCGHTHKPYYKSFGDKLLVNAGSVGKPKTGSPKANYVIINIKEDKISVDTMYVDYDFEKAAAAIEAEGLPSEFAEIIRTGIA